MKQKIIFFSMGILMSFLFFKSYVYLENRKETVVKNLSHFKYSNGIFKEIEIRNNKLKTKLNYDTSGSLVSISFLDSNQKFQNGFVEFFSNGKIKLVGNLNNSIQDGTGYIFDINGNLLEKWNYRNVKNNLTNQGGVLLNEKAEIIKKRTHLSLISDFDTIMLEDTLSLNICFQKPHLKGMYYVKGSFDNFFHVKNVATLDTIYIDTTSCFFNFIPSSRGWNSAKGIVTNYQINNDNSTSYSLPFYFKYDYFVK